MIRAGCPDVRNLEALLGEEGTGSNTDELIRHLESCPECQRTLETLAAEPTLWEDTAQGLGGALRQEPALRSVMERLKRNDGALAADLSFLRPADRPDLLGLLGPYEVLEVIGRGGMGVVLKAYDPPLNRIVAIKVPSVFLASSVTARRRFIREAKAAAAINHDHIVTVHGVYESDGLPYLVMQYIVGESLQNRLDRTGQLDVVEIVEIGLQTAQGLAAAHAQGLIHRDIKPANLLLSTVVRSPSSVAAAETLPGANNGLRTTGYGPVKITDFGLARMTDDVQLTHDGVVAGTPQYMAPEQARGELLDHRADLFSLGSVLYALCTGVPPFRAVTAVAVLRQVSDDEPAPVRSLNPEVPGWLETLIARLMAKHPMYRIQSAAEVTELLEGYLAHLRDPRRVPAPQLPALPSTPASIPEDEENMVTPAHQVRDFVRRSRVPSIVLLASLVVGSLGLLALWLVPIVLGLDQPRQKVVLETDAIKPVPGKVDVWSVAISRDGTIVAAGAGMWDQPGEIGVWNVQTQEPLAHFADDLGVASVALSPDGKRLASGSWSSHVRVWDWAAGKQVFDFPVDGVARVAFSPDGKMLATATEGHAAQLWDLVEGKLVADLEGDLFRFHCVTFSPDGRRVFAGGGDWTQGGLNQVTVWDVATKKQVMQLTGHQNAILGIAFSPDGKTIATSGVDRTIRLWDGENGQMLKTLRGHRHWAEGLTFSPDGKTLISGGLDSTVRFWDVETGQQTNSIVTPGETRTVRMTPDSGTLLAGGGMKSLKLFDTSTLKERATLWGGNSVDPTPMDRLPILYPTTVTEKGWLTAAGLVALSLGFFVSIGFVVGLVAWRRRGDHFAASTTAANGTFAFACSECGSKLRVKSEVAGKRVKCPKCDKPTRVPDIPTSEMVVSALPRRWARPGVLLAFAAAGLFGFLLLVGLWRLHGSDEPYISRLQILADRVRAQRSDRIDARPYSLVTDKDLVVLDGLSNLKVLNLDHTAITDEGLKAVAKATNLKEVSLTNTQVTDIGLAEIKTLTNLEELRLDKLPITDAGLAHLSAFPNLKKLSLYQTGVTNDGLAHLALLYSLERLSLDDTQIGDEGLRQLTACAKLSYLSVWKTQVTPAGIGALRKALPGLKVNK